MDVYPPRPTKRRRTRTEMAAVTEGLAAIVAEDAPMTVRQVFYRAVAAGIVGKTEGEYKETVIRLLGSMRRSGRIPFGAIADNTRWMRKPRTWSSLDEALRRTAEVYRRALWDLQECYVEVWLEKDALAGVLYEVTEAWDCPLMVTRGDSRAKSFVGDSVEVDAIPPAILRNLVAEVIERHVDGAQLMITQVAEEEERMILERLARREVA